MPPAPTGPQAAQAHRRGSGLLAHLLNVYHLVVKELRSIRADPIMLILVAYAFSIAVYTVATGASTEANNLTVGVVDEDRSDLSRRLLDATATDAKAHMVHGNESAEPARKPFRLDGRRIVIMGGTWTHNHFLVL